MLIPPRRQPELLSLASLLPPAAEIGFARRHGLAAPLAAPTGSAVVLSLASLLPPAAEVGFARRHGLAAPLAAPAGSAVVLSLVSLLPPAAEIGFPRRHGLAAPLAAPAGSAVVLSLVSPGNSSRLTGKDFCTCKSGSYDRDSQLPSPFRTINPNSDIIRGPSVSHSLLVISLEV